MKNSKLFKLNLIFFIAMTSIAVIFLLEYMQIITNDALASFLVQIMTMFAIPLLLYTLFISKNIKQTFVDCGFKKINGKILILTLILGVILTILNFFVAVASQTVISLFGFESLSSIQANVGSDLMFEFFFSAILPGICEEFLFRGIMLHANKKLTNPRYALLISSILFGFTHMNINKFFYTAILGGLMGYTTLVADSIIPSMIIHFMNNFFNCLPMEKLLPGIMKIVNIIFSNTLIFIFISSISILLLIYLYILITRKIYRERIKMNVHSTAKHLNLKNLPPEQAELYLAQLTKILKDKQSPKILMANTKISFVDSVFMICSVVLGSTITIMTFIWGIL